MTMTIPGYGALELTHIVCDYNGTIAKDGILLSGIRERFEILGGQFTLHVVTADTFGSVEKQLEGSGVKVTILQSDDHTREKADLVTSLGADHCIALGNGNNDRMMLETAAVGIAVLGDEGCSRDAMLAADLLCAGVFDALDLLVSPKRLVATLRR